MSIVMIALNSGFLDRSVHALDLAVRPWMLDLGQPMFDVIFLAAHIEHMRHVSCRRAIRVARRESELDPIVGEPTCLTELAQDVALDFAEAKVRVVKFACAYLGRRVTVIRPWSAPDFAIQQIPGFTSAKLGVCRGNKSGPAARPQG